MSYAAWPYEAAPSEEKREALRKAYEAVPEHLRMEALEPLLRVYEGCGRAYLGRVEGANVIKIHRRSGKLSYLSYPDFGTDPHPAFARCVKLSLRTRALECFDYADRENPPVLHRKETFLHADNPMHARFSASPRRKRRRGCSRRPGPSELATVGRGAWPSEGST